MRHLEQDVRGFWQFMDRAAGSVASDRDKLAETMVGRTLEGDPLVPAKDKNDFTFDGDENGLRCPFGAHVRRANPRTADYPAGVHAGLDKLINQLALQPRKFRDDLIASTRFHRILRRGREYGPGLSREDALRPAPPADPERGLHFICLNANISRQFEFVQNAWLMNSKFNGMSGESDPLLGNREPIVGGALRTVSPSPGRAALVQNFRACRSSSRCVAAAIFSCQACALYATLSKPGLETLRTEGSVRRWGGS